MGRARDQAPTIAAGLRPPPGVTEGRVDEDLGLVPFGPDRCRSDSSAFPPQVALVLEARRLSTGKMPRKCRFDPAPELGLNEAGAGETIPVANSLLRRPIVIATHRHLGPPR
jgi:hypothetical protein